MYFLVDNVNEGNHHVRLTINECIVYRDIEGEGMNTIEHSIISCCYDYLHWINTKVIGTVP